MPRATNVLLSLFVALTLTDALAGGLISALGQIIPGLVWTERWSRLPLTLIMHSGASQLLMDVAALYVLGPVIERLYGGGRMVWVFLLSAAAGTVASVAIRPGDAVTAASGGILGLVGLLVGLITFEPKAIPEPGVSRLKVVLPLVVLCSVAVGVFEPGANHVLHLAGLFAGVLLSRIFATRRQSIPVAWMLVASAVLLGGMSIMILRSKTSIRGTLAWGVAYSGELREARDLDRAIQVMEGVIDAPLAGSADRVMLPFAQNQLAYLYVEARRNIARGIELSEASNRRVENNPALLDTLGYLYAMADRCADARDAMSRAADIDPAYGPRRDEVTKACQEGRFPDPDIDVEGQETPPPREPRPVIKA